MSTRRFMHTMIIAALGTLAAAPALSQGPPGGGMMGGPRMQMDRPGVQSRMALDAPGLNLTAAQKTQIDTLTDAYLAEQTKLREKYPMTPGNPPSQDMMSAMRTARENFTAAVGKVMTDAQRKTWEAALAAMPQMGPGMGMGPPGGGAPGGAPPPR